MKVVIDTNIFISILIGKSFSDFYLYLFSGKVEILTTDEQVKEILDVVQRPKFSKYFSESDSKDLLSLIKNTSTYIRIENNIHDCRDEKDNFILEIAIKGKADVIVTGDLDLLDLHPYHGIEIIRYKEWESKVRKL